MRNRLALVVTLLLTAPVHGQETEKKETNEVGGRSLSEWIKDITHKDPSRREVAIRAVVAFGPERAYEAVPAILAELRRNNASYPIDLSVRVSCATTLGMVLAAKRDADPKLVKEAVTLLTRLLKDGQAIVKLRAVQALGGIGPPYASGAVSDIYPLLRERYNYELRQTGAIAIGVLASDRSVKVSTYLHTALLELLTDPVSGVRQSACSALTTVGTPAEPAQKTALLRALEKLAKTDPEPSVQIWANYAVMGYNEKVGGPNLDAITQYLSKGEVTDKMHAAQALGRMGSYAKDAAPAVIARLGDSNLDVVAASVWVLGRLESPLAIPALEKVAADKKQPEAIQKAAKEAVDLIKKAKAAASK